MLNSKTLYLFQLAKALEKQLTFDFNRGELTFKPNKKWFFDKCINFEMLGEFNLNAVEQTQSKGAEGRGTIEFEDINDGFTYYIMQRYIENLLCKAFNLSPQDGKVANISYFALANIIKSYKLPIISIDNPELIQMITDTDTEIEFNPHEVKLPFENFLLKFVLDDNVVELFINKATLTVTNSENNQIMIWGTGVIVNKDGFNGQIGVQIAGEVELEYVDDVDDNAEEVQRRDAIIKFVRKLIYYFSLEKTTEYIDKVIKKRAKSNSIRSIQEQRYGISIINLFSDIRYNYHHTTEKGEGKPKAAHLVRGHFRRQPFGNRAAPEIKIIWIQPYFTGNEFPKDNKKYVIAP